VQLAVLIISFPDLLPSATVEIYSLSQLSPMIVSSSLPLLYKS
jgi:hypothetical protein